MSEADYQRGLRGGDFNNFHEPGAWKDWEDGHRACLEAIRASEREQEERDDARAAASGPRLFIYPGDLFRAIESSGCKLNNISGDRLSYFAVVDGIKRLIQAANSGEYLMFYAHTHFQFVSESDFSHDLLFKALCVSDKTAETYLAINQKEVVDSQGNSAQKWVLLACNDKWKGIMNAEWLPIIHTALCNMCSQIEHLSQ